MFWKKKAAVPAEGSTVPVAPGAVSPPTVQVEKAVEEKFAKPQNVPKVVRKYLEEQKKVDPNRIYRMKALLRPSAKKETALDIRIYEEAEATTLKVKDYASLDEHTDLIIYEGWFDEGAKQVELEDKRAKIDVPIYTKKELQEKIEQLSQPSSTVFFYLCGSPASGGPLGRGAAVVQLNPDYPNKGKKYIMYTANVKDLEPVGTWQKFMEDNNPKSIAGWIKERHFKPIAE